MSRMLMLYYFLPYCKGTKLSFISSVVPGYSVSSTASHPRTISVEPFRTLEKTLLLELTYPEVTTSHPILPDLKKSPKLFWLDTGLVNYVAGMQEQMLFNADADELWNGDIAEHIVAQELLGSDFTFGKKRMFWVRDAKNSQAEVDFIISFKGHLLPIEVKTGSNSKLKSLHIFMADSKERIALRLWNGPMTSDSITKPNGERFTLYNIPIYYAGHLETFLLTLI